MSEALEVVTEEITVELHEGGAVEVVEVGLQGPPGASGGGGTYTAGGGLQLVGNQFSVVADPSGGITVDAGGVGTDPAVIAHLADLVFGEIPSGVVNGTNTTFTLANTPIAATVRLYQNGLRLREGAGNDYTLSGSTLTFSTPPASGDVILVDYVISRAT